LDYVDELIAEHPEMVITVIVSDADSNKWYHDLLSENVALQLRNALAKRSNVVVANIRHQVDAE
jgi:cell division protein FtsI/penicillin-binding protein 2